MRCPACKSTLTLHDAETTAKGEIYKCPHCGTRSTPNFDWKLLLVLAMVAAPVLDVLVQFILQTFGKYILGPAVASNDAITAISMIGTAIILIMLYSYLRRPKIIHPDSAD